MLEDAVLLLKTQFAESLLVAIQVAAVILANRIEIVQIAIVAVVNGRAGRYVLLHLVVVAQNDVAVQQLDAVIVQGVLQLQLFVHAVHHVGGRSAATDYTIPDQSQIISERIAHRSIVDQNWSLVDQGTLARSEQVLVRAVAWQRNLVVVQCVVV